MLEALFTNPAAAPRLRTSPFGAWLDSFTDRLVSLGYPPASCRSFVVLAADLGRWMAERKFHVGTFDERVLGAYIAHRGTQLERRRAASLHFLAHLRVEGVVPLPLCQPCDGSPLTAHCERYAEYLRTVRGAAVETAESYVTVIREFLYPRFGTGAVDLATLTASDVGDFLVSRGQRLSAKRIGLMATALRSFFRFAFARGETPSDLSTAVLSARMTRLSNVPRYLTTGDIEKLLSACDLNVPNQRRDHAMLLLMARLGLRAREVAALEVDDVRWRSGELVVRGKGNVFDRLPLLPEVGKALALYLIQDRPKTSSRQFFLRAYAPAQGLRGGGAVRAATQAAIERAGLCPPIGGTHLLRHSLGTHMIRAGASLAEIGQVLRHHASGTTETYAKVDFEALRALAQPWPGAGGE